MADQQYHTESIKRTQFPEYSAAVSRTRAASAQSPEECQQHQQRSAAPILDKLGGSSSSAPKSAETISDARDAKLSDCLLAFALALSLYVVRMGMITMFGDMAKIVPLLVACALAHIINREFGRLPTCVFASVYAIGLLIPMD